MARCRRCNRILKTQPWANMGIGKICSRKESAEISRNDSDEDKIIPYDGGVVFIERVDPSRGTVGGIRTNIQRRIYRHSPTGFNFGYGGSGPADTALNCLLMFTDQPTAERLYQQFKFEYFGREGNRIEIQPIQIQAFIAANQ